MTETDDSQRNPLLIPKGEVKRVGPHCPACKKANFDGRNIQGVLHFSCRECGNKWEGGLPQVPQDPRVPHPYFSPQLPTFELNPRTKEVVEFRKPVNPTQSFRTKSGLAEQYEDELNE